MRVFGIVLRVLNVDIAIIRTVGIVGIVRIIGLEEVIKVVRLTVSELSILVVLSFFPLTKRECGVILKVESKGSLGLKGFPEPLNFLGGGT